MADEIFLYLDLAPLVKDMKDLSESLQKRLQVAAKNLSIQTHAHVKEQAAQKLHTRLGMFNENLRLEQIDDNTWSIVVDEKGRWIEDGMEQHSMLDDLLASPKAKRARDGSKYIVVPFKHSKGPTQQTPHQRAIKQVLKEELKKLKIPYGGIERNADGSPKVGLLHSHDFARGSDRQAPGHQGPASFPMAKNHLPNGVEGAEGRPYLFGLRIYQRLKRNPDGSPKLDKAGHAMASREIFTFRVASSKHKGRDMWIHPGLAPMHFLEEAYEWAKDQFDNHIAPEIMKDI